MGLLSQISLALGKLVRLWYEVTEGYVSWECRLEAETIYHFCQKGASEAGKVFHPSGATRLWSEKGCVSWERAFQCSLGT